MVDPRTVSPYARHLWNVGSVTLQEFYGQKPHQAKSFHAAVQAISDNAQRLAMIEDLDCDGVTTVDEAKQHIRSFRDALAGGAAAAGDVADYMQRFARDCQQGWQQHQQQGGTLSFEAFEAQARQMVVGLMDGLLNLPGPYDAKIIDIHGPCG